MEQLSRDGQERKEKEFFPTVDVNRKKQTQKLQHNAMCSRSSEQERWALSALTRRWLQLYRGNWPVTEETRGARRSHQTHRTAG